LGPQSARCGSGCGEFTTISFFIFRKDLSHEDIRAAFTVSFLFNASLCLVLMASADFVARLYGQDKLALLIRVSAVVHFLEVFAAPIVVLFQRDMAFGKVSLINVSNAALMAGSTVAFAVYRDPSPVFGMSTSIVVIGNSRFCCKPAPVFFLEGRI
jgi:O-antigen/teichoic acid export membrane protein